MVQARQADRRVPVQHRLITHHYGENYWFNGAARDVMECLGGREARLPGLDGDTAAVRGRAEHSLSHGHALDAVRFVEGAGHAVYIHIAAEQHRKKIRNRRRMQNETPPHVIVGRRFRRRLSDYYTLRARKKQHGFPAKRRFSHFCQNLIPLDNALSAFYNEGKEKGGGKAI